MAASELLRLLQGTGSHLRVLAAAATPAAMQPEVLAMLAAAPAVGVHTCMNAFRHMSMVAIAASMHTIHDGSTLWISCRAPTAEIRCSLAYTYTEDTFEHVTYAAPTEWPRKAIIE